MFKNKFAIVLLVMLGSVGLAQDWPQWRGPQRDGVVKDFAAPAVWPDDVKVMMREYPNVFSTRVIFNQFVSRGFKSNEKLRAAVTAKIKTTLENDSPPENLSLPENKVEEIAKDLTQQMKMKIGIKGNTEKGRIVIDYRSAKEMERVVALIKRFGSHKSLEK